MAQPKGTSMNRRRLLAISSTVALATIAGCTGDDAQDDADGEPTDDDTSSEDPDAENDDTQTESDDADDTEEGLHLAELVITPDALLGDGWETVDERDGDGAVVRWYEWDDGAQSLSSQVIDLATDEEYDDKDDFAEWYESARQFDAEHEATESFEDLSIATESYGVYRENVDGEEYDAVVTFRSESLIGIVWIVTPGEPDEDLPLAVSIEEAAALAEEQYAEW